MLRFGDNCFFVGGLLLQFRPTKYEYFYTVEFVGRDNDTYPSNTRRRPNVGLLLAHRLRCEPIIIPALGQRLVFAG